MSDNKCTVDSASPQRGQELSNAPWPSVGWVPSKTASNATTLSLETRDKGKDKDVAPTPITKNTSSPAPVGGSQQTNQKKSWQKKKGPAKRAWRPRNKTSASVQSLTDEIEKLKGEKAVMRSEMYQEKNDAADKKKAEKKQKRLQKMATDKKYNDESSYDRTWSVLATSFEGFPAVDKNKLQMYNQQRRPWLLMLMTLVVSAICGLAFLGEVYQVAVCSGVVIHVLLVCIFVAWPSFVDVKPDLQAFRRAQITYKIRRRELIDSHPEDTRADAHSAGKFKHESKLAGYVVQVYFSIPQPQTLQFHEYYKKCLRFDIADFFQHGAEEGYFKGYRVYAPNRDILVSEELLSQMVGSGAHKLTRTYEEAIKTYGFIAQSNRSVNISRYQAAEEPIYANTVELAAFIWKCDSSQSRLRGF